MRANFANTTGSSEVRGTRGRLARRAPANRAAGVTSGLAPRRQAAGPDRLGGEHAEQVEIGRLFVVENAHLMPGAAGGVENLEPIRGLDQAHRAVDLLAHRVRGRRYGREAGQFREDALRRELPELGPLPAGELRLRRRRGRRGGRRSGLRRRLAWRVRDDTDRRGRRCRAPGRRLQRQLGLARRRDHGEIGFGVVGVAGPGGLGPRVVQASGMRAAVLRAAAVRAAVLRAAVIWAGRVRLSRVRAGQADRRLRAGQFDRRLRAGRADRGVRASEVDRRARPGQVDRRVRAGQVRYGVRAGQAGRVRVRERRGRLRNRRAAGPGGPMVRIVHAFLDDVEDLVARGDQLEYPAVYLPVAELLRLVGVVAQVGDVQPVTEVVEHDAAVAPEPAHRPRLPQRLHVPQAQLLAPVTGGGLETEFLRRRARGEQHDVV